MNDESRPDNIADLIRARREAQGLTQSELAQKVGTNQQTIQKIEGNKIKRSGFYPQILTELGLSLDLLVPAPQTRHTVKKPTSTAPISQDLPVHGAAEGGKGALVVTVDPVEYVARPQPLLHVREGYGVIVVEDSMAPEFEPGDIALVHPHLPPVIGRTCVFYAQRQDGTVEALIKRLRRVTTESWHVRQFNPRDGDKSDFILKRAEWQTCHVTVGKYSGRS